MRVIFRFKIPSDCWKKLGILLCCNLYMYNYHANGPGV